ncbi:MAG: hypothetical protein Q9184_005984 [Pyrenodesmia sp. 2 TL-2023]
MVRLESHLSGQDWDNVLNSHEPIIHFFNEPDKNNISPERAAQVWHDQMVPLLRQQRGKQLVGPSVASDDNGKNWLADFMNRVSDAPPDLLGVHYIKSFTIQLANFMDNTDWIFEYGLFGCMRNVADGFVSPDAQLMRPDGTLTDLMKKLQWDQPIEW